MLCFLFRWTNIAGKKVYLNQGIAICKVLENGRVINLITEQEIDWFESVNQSNKNSEATFAITYKTKKDFIRDIMFASDLDEFKYNLYFYRLLTKIIKTDGTNKKLLAELLSYFTPEIPLDVVVKKMSLTCKIFDKEDVDIA